MTRIVADAYFCTEIRNNGRRDHLVRHNGDWTWLDESRISNIKNFPIGENPLTNLLNGKSNEQFSINHIGAEENQEYDFSFSEEQGKVFVIDTKKTNLIEVPALKKQQKKRKNSESDEYSLTPYNLDTLYSLAEDIAVDE